MPTMLDRMRMVQGGELPPPPVATLIGFTISSIESFTTLELKINFLKPVWSGKLSATGYVVKSGRMVGLVDCDIHDDKQALVARASSTCMTLRGEQAQGR